MIGKFEDGSIARDEWRHEDHLYVACHYLMTMQFDEALDRMRAGIRSLLVSFGIDPAADGSPYHETLTVFWMRAVARFVDDEHPTSLFEACSKLAAMFPKDYPSTFYSQELLNSDVARIRFLEPDIRPCP